MPAPTNPTATTISAATTFSGNPTISQLAANSFATIANIADLATFTLEIITSAFVGTLTFYGLEVDGSTLVPISAHLRNSATIANNTAINTAVAFNQVWVGSIATFKAFYAVCTAFTSGTVSVQPGLSAAPYAVSISNGMALGQALGIASLPVVPASDYIGPVNITKILGIALSSTNPLIIQQQLVAAGLAAQVYHVSTGILTGTSGQAGLSIFNANKNKTVIFLSLQSFNSTSGQTTRLYWIPTTDPAFGTPQTPYNAYVGGAASAIAGNCSSAAGGLTVPGSDILRSGNIASSAAYEFLANGIPVILPPNANNGIAMYINGSVSDKIGFSATYIEY